MTDLTSPLNLVLCILVCTLVTYVPRTLPLFCLGKNLPDWLKDWLGFVPATVMAALVAPDVFFYGGSLGAGVFNPNPLDNLFLLVALVTLVFSLVVKNFFVIIVFAMALVAGIRFFGFMA